MNPPIAVQDLSIVAVLGGSSAAAEAFMAANFSRDQIIPLPDAGEDGRLDLSTPWLQALAGRLVADQLVAINATTLAASDRALLASVARTQYVPAVAILLATAPSETSGRREGGAEDGMAVLNAASLGRLEKQLRRVGFRHVHVVEHDAGHREASVVLEQRRTDLRDRQGPFDVIGDVHGCMSELSSLLGRLGWSIDEEGHTEAHPEGRSLVFVGDLVDRGPATPEVLELAMRAVDQGWGMCIAGNHELKLLKALRGQQVLVENGLAESLAQLADRSDSFRARTAEFLSALPSHLVLADGRLVIAHAGLPEAMHNRETSATAGFSAYGRTSGEIDQKGRPVRLAWADSYEGRAVVVYGHTPVPQPEWVNRTICVDTGCVFGGRLTALRWPERELVSVPAMRKYYG